MKIFSMWLLFSLLFFQAKFTTCQKQSSCNSADFSALQGFMSSLHSDIEGWSFNSSSTSTVTCCNWTGVTCDNSTGRVIGLDLQSMNLKGSISPSLANLDELVWLNLTSNFLTGMVPDQLFYLPQLERLDLSSNELSGTIPIYSNLPSIRVFNVSSNKLNQSLPALNGSLNIEIFDVSYNLFDGSVNPILCNFSSKIRILHYTMNQLTGEFPTGFGNCLSVEELWLDSNMISGSLPDDLFMLSNLKYLYLRENKLSGRMSTRFSNLSNLLALDISFNSFSGNIPNIFDRLSKLELFYAYCNFFRGTIPSSLANSASLTSLYLRNNSLSGEINLNCSTMTQLSSLDLGVNQFSGPIDAVGSCVQLKSLNLARNSLTGEIPTSFKNLKFLSSLSLSNNSFSNVTSALLNLQDLPSLTSLVLTRNFFNGEYLPIDGINGFKGIEVFVIASCPLYGVIPPWIAHLTKLKVLDLSWNRLNGSIPSWIGDLENLFYLDLSNNSLTGELPVSLTTMKGLISGNSSQQSTQTDDFPFYVKRNTTGKGLQYNQISSFPPSLYLLHNLLTGPILPGFGNLKNVHIFDLSYNRISGTIPDELSGMSSLEIMGLSNNNLTGSIPSTLVNLNFLSSFDVAYNNLSGSIPTGGQFSTFSSSDFEGNPYLCGFHKNACEPKAATPTTTGNKKNKGIIVTVAVGAALGMTCLVVIIYLVLSRIYLGRQDCAVEAVGDSNGSLELNGSSLVLLFQNRGENKELTINDILKSTNSFDQANIIGCGGFGLVYKATLPDGSKLAIKRLSGDFGQMEREFNAEIETLSKVQHQNLVLLQGYCRTGNDRLLIYSYMENGSLDYWLHEKPEGTLGYIPPEYGQSSVATYNGDVYSFGVVLLELLTGRRPVDMCKPRGDRELVSWTTQMKKQKREIEVFDAVVYEKKHERQMMQMLEIACFCVSDSPKARPPSHQLVTWLDAIGLPEIGVE
ncbi:phytosulfokine receptor 1-like protein [Carex littledalei]|uniref:non-specific serine/threonine protein kinase n=1 Tax=Carex littledalei TaxID=544730 RepID=A0A833QNX0_9POAL|nr:phytosulfokine receptor 1-like protein [Carex littledalei]